MVENLRFDGMEKDLYDHVLDLFNILLDEMPAEMMLQCNGSGSEKFVISAPDFLLNKFLHALQRKFAYQSFQPGEMGALLTYRGINMVPSPDLAITIFHKDYPLFREDWMIYKIPLTPPVHDDKGRYKRTTFHIARHFGFEDRNYKLN